MGSDLHHMAYVSGGLHGVSSQLGWEDLSSSFGVFNADVSLVMDDRSTGNAPFFASSSQESDLSTGYLQDALLEFSDRFKRRRLTAANSDQGDQLHGSNDLTMRYWDSSSTWDLSGKLNCTSQTTSVDEVSGELMNTSMTRISDETTINLGDTEEAAPPEAQAADSSSSSYIKDSFNKSSVSCKSPIYSLPPTGEKGDKRKKEKVAYPFAVVKPGATEGEVTLNDINERILMPPTRPVRHPVGDFACRPFVTAARGQGLSGKAVVALTRIHTQGRGTITIIRTKG